VADADGLSANYGEFAEVFHEIEILSLIPFHISAP